MIPMPIDFQLSFHDGTKEIHYVPLDLMYGAKPAENDIPRTVYPAWKWTSETYTISTKRRLMDIQAGEIDPSQRLADLDRRNNKIELRKP